MDARQRGNQMDAFSQQVEELAAGVAGRVIPLEGSAEGPSVSVCCAGVEDVIAVVRFGRENGLPVRVSRSRATKHGTGVVADLSLMKRVEVDAAARQVRVQAGVSVAEVDRATQRYGLATPTGIPSTANVAALTLNGSAGWLRRRYGTSQENVLAVERVTADGQMVTDGRLLEGDAGKGGLLQQAGKGVVTALTFRLHPVGPEVVLLMAVYAASLARTALTTWRDWTRTAPREVSTDFFFWKVPAISPFPPSLHNRPVVIMAGLYAGEVQAGLSAFRPLRRVGERLIDLTGPVPYVAAQGMFDPFLPEGIRLDGYSRPLSSLDDERVERLLAAAERRPGQTLLAVRHLGGESGRAQGAYLLSVNAGTGEDEESRQLWTELAER